jgi:hypothetical protein
MSEVPYLPIHILSHNAGAVQALLRGDCPEHLQKDFINWLLNDVCGTYDQSYRHDTHDTAFAEGKRWVGNTIVKASKLDPAKLPKSKEEIR